jgi:energy-coupling factor transporter transmembrane protein EcfT
VFSVLHPTTRLSAWLALLVAVQFLSGTPLAVAFVLVPLLGKRVFRRGWLLIRRTRWLLLSLFAVFAWGTPGEPVWNVSVAPSWEGIREAALHLGRLLLVLFSVAGFLENMPLADLLEATHALLKPLRRIGIDSDRGVVRLMLVLRYVETLPRPRDWKSLLDAPEVCTSEVVEIGSRTMTWPDRLVVLGLLGATALLLLWATGT